MRAREELPRQRNLHRLTDAVNWHELAYQQGFILGTTTVLQGRETIPAPALAQSLQVVLGYFRHDPKALLSQWSNHGRFAFREIQSSSDRGEWIAVAHDDEILARSPRDAPGSG